MVAWSQAPPELSLGYAGDLSLISVMVECMEASSVRAYLGEAEDL